MQLKKHEKRQVISLSDTRKSLRYFIKYLRPYWKGITLVVLFTIIFTWAQVEAPHYLGLTLTALTKYVEQYFNPATRATASMILNSPLNLQNTFSSRGLVKMSVNCFSARTCLRSMSPLAT